MFQVIDVWHDCKQQFLKMFAFSTFSSYTSSLPVLLYNVFCLPSQKAAQKHQSKDEEISLCCDRKGQ